MLNFIKSFFNKRPDIPDDKMGELYVTIEKHMEDCKNKNPENITQRFPIFPDFKSGKWVIKGGVGLYSFFYDVYFNKRFIGSIHTSIDLYKRDGKVRLRTTKVNSKSLLSYIGNERFLIKEELNRAFLPFYIVNSD